MLAIKPVLKKKVSTIQIGKFLVQPTMWTEDNSASYHFAMEVYLKPRAKDTRTYRGQLLRNEFVMYLITKTPLNASDDVYISIKEYIEQMFNTITEKLENLSGEELDKLEEAILADFYINEWDNFNM